MEKKAKYLQIWKICRDNYLLNLTEIFQLKLETPRVKDRETSSVQDFVQIKENIPTGSLRKLEKYEQQRCCCQIEE